MKYAAFGFLVALVSCGSRNTSSPADSGVPETSSPAPVLDAGQVAVDAGPDPASPYEGMFEITMERLPIEPGLNEECYAQDGGTIHDYFILRNESRGKLTLILPGFEEKCTGTVEGDTYRVSGCMLTFADGPNELVVRWKFSDPHTFKGTTEVLGGTPFCPVAFSTFGKRYGT